MKGKLFVLLAAIFALATFGATSRADACGGQGKAGCGCHGAKADCPCKSGGECTCGGDCKCGDKADCPCKGGGECTCGGDCKCGDKAAPAAAGAPKAFDAKPAVGTKATCPVTGEEFTVSAETVFSEYDGKFYGFCCGGCKPKFDADPAKYAGK